MRKPKLRCVLFGHRTGKRPPFYGWTWLGMECKWCHKYPVGRLAKVRRVW